MKIYDYLICKQDYSDLIKDRKYEISWIGNMTFTSVITMEIEHLYFSTNKYNGYGLPYLYDYFYSQQEERKLKLDKLNGLQIQKW